MDIVSLLNKAGLSMEQFEFYKAQFASNRHPYLVPGNKTVKFLHGQEKGLTDMQIARHLAGLGDYGSSSGSFTDYFALDIDNHDHSLESIRDFEERLQNALRLFPAATLIRSSDSGGVHLYQFLDEPVPLAELRRYVEKRLNRHGLVLESGKYELFPSTTMCMRLPLGKSSYILDIETLNRINTSKSQDIWFIQNISDRLILVEVFDKSDLDSSLSPDLSPDLSPEAKVPSIVTPKTTPFKASVRESTYVRNPTPESETLFEKECLRLLEAGLEKPHCRWVSVSKLIVYAMKIKGLNDKDTFGFVWDWLQKKHNGFSREYNGNPEGVKQITLSQVNAYFNNSASSWRGLSRREASLVLREDLTYAEQMFTMELLRWWKTAHIAREKVHIDARLFWRHFKSASSETYLQRRNKVIEIGFLEKVSGHFQEEHIPSLYRIKFEFDVDPAEDEFHVLDHVIITLLKPEEIRRRYTGYRVRGLLRQQRQMYQAERERRE